EKDGSRFLIDENGIGRAGVEIELGAGMTRQSNHKRDADKRCAPQAPQTNHELSAAPWRRSQLKPFSINTKSWATSQGMWPVPARRQRSHLREDGSASD